MARGQEVAAGYRLTNGSLRLSVEPGALARGGQVRAAARYEVRAATICRSWAGPASAVASEHLERIDLYRSRWRRGRGRETSARQSAGARRGRPGRSAGQASSGRR